MTVATAEMGAASEVEPGGSMTRRVVGNSLWLIARPLLLNLLSIASNLYIVRKLGPGDYGAFNLGFAQVALFAPLCNLGLRAVAIRAIAEDRSRAPVIVGALFALRILLTGLAVALIAGWLALPTYSLSTRLIGAAAVCSMVCVSMGGAVIDLFQGFERARVNAQCQMVGGVALTLLSVAALLAGLGLPGFVAAYVIGAVFQLYLLHRAASRELFPVRPIWDRARMKELACQARPFALLSALSSVTDAPVVDVLILGALFGSGTVGPYTAALGLVLRLLMIPHGISDALYPAVAAGYREQRAEVEASLRRSILNLALITLPAAICLSFTAPAVLGILYGNRYLSASGALAVAGWLLPLIGLNYLMRESLNAVHQQQTTVRLTLVSCVLLIALYAALIPPFGILGAAVAGIAREAIMLGFWAQPFRRQFGQPFPGRDLARVAAACAALAVPLLLWGRGHGYPAAVASAALGGLFYAATVLQLGLVRLKPRSRGVS